MERYPIANSPRKAPQALFPFDLATESDDDSSGSETPFAPEFMDVNLEPAEKAEQARLEARIQWPINAPQHENANENKPAIHIRAPAAPPRLGWTGESDDESSASENPLPKFVAVIRRHEKQAKAAYVANFESDDESSASETPLPISPIQIAATRSARHLQSIRPKKSITKSKSRAAKAPKTPKAPKGTPFVRNLKELIVNQSSADSWDEARLEWAVGFDETSEGTSNCCCGHWIKYIYRAINRHNGRQLVFGSVCKGVFDDK